MFLSYISKRKSYRRVYIAINFSSIFKVVFASATNYFTSVIGNWNMAEILPSSYPNYLFLLDPPTFIKYSQF